MLKKPKWEYRHFYQIPNQIHVTIFAASQKEEEESGVRNMFNRDTLPQMKDSHLVSKNYDFKKWFLYFNY